MPPRVTHLLRTLALACFLAATPLAVPGDDAAPARPAEYMIYQYPGVSLVVVVDAREVAFDTRITGPDRGLVGEAGVPARRLGPVYHFVEAADIPRQLMVAVTTERPVERSRISMELLQLPEGDRNARVLTAAYRYLAHGMKRVYEGTPSAWSERIVSLRNASQAFASMGNEEMKLWADYYAAHLALHGLGDTALALEWVQAVRSKAERARFDRLILVALLLEADALTVAAERGDETTTTYYARAHERWLEAAEQAGRQGFQAEQGRALYRDGLAWEREGENGRAIERYEQALEITAGSSDPELLNQVRATAAAAYESSGRTAGAIGLLEDISGDLAADGETASALELARSLHEKGRLLNRMYRFEESRSVLEESLALRKEYGDGAWGETGIELGRSLLALGLKEEAATVLGDSMARVSEGGRPGPSAGYALLATIAREQGRFEAMQDFREQQGRYLASDAVQAAYLFETALDALRRDGPRSAAARRALRDARSRAAGSDWLTGQRSQLYLCLLDRQETGCTHESAQGVYRALRASGIPQVEVDSWLAWIRWLEQGGRKQEARASMVGLLDRVQFYRELLPGVIAQWYADRRGELFGLALEQLRSATAADVLLALERLRRLERIDSDDAAPEEAVRGQLARVQAAQPSPDDSLSRQTARELQAFFAGAGWSSGAPGPAELDAARRALAPDALLVSHFFAGDELLAITAGREAVRLHRLGGSDRVRKALETARARISETAGDMPARDFDELGRWLLGPVLPPDEGTIYLMPFGPLIGFPLDALRVGGRHAIEQHRFAYVDSLAAAGGKPGRLEPGFEDRVFLAGNPRAGRDLFSYGVSTSEEITAVRDRFVGDGLTIVQGVALRSDEFADERIATAGLIHLAMPGRIDLSHPGRSRLLLSGEREQPSAEFLDPASIRQLAIVAGLGVLSDTATHARPLSDFDCRLGLVDDLQIAGALRVVATLWPLGDAETADFMARFYDALLARGDVVEALVQTRRAVLASGGGGNFRAWAGFQLYIR